MIIVVKSRSHQLDASCNHYAQFHFLNIESLDAFAMITDLDASSEGVQPMFVGHWCSQRIYVFNSQLEKPKTSLLK